MTQPELSRNNFADTAYVQDREKCGVFRDVRKYKAAKSFGNHNPYRWL